MLLRETFEIISAMNKREKSFFKRYCKLYSNNLNSRNYLLLYEEIQKQVKNKCFDEAKLMKVIQKKMDSKYFNNAKQYLHQQLLNSLLSYHKTNDPDLKISNMIQTSMILQKKNLFTTGMRILGKAKKEALTKEEIPHLLSVLNITSSMINFNEKDFDKNLREEAQYALQQYDELNRALLICNQCTRLFISEFTLHPKDARIPKLYKNDLLKKDWKFSTNKAKIYALSARIVLAMMTGNFKEIIPYEKTIVSISKESGLLENMLIKSYRNIINVAIQLKDEAIYQEYKTRLIELDLSNFVWYSTFLNQIEISYCRVFNKKTKGLELVEKFKERYWGEIALEVDPSEALFIIYIICFLCQVEEYQAALDWVLFWYNAPYTHLYSKRRLVVKTMELIIHTELENYLLIPSLNNALKRDMQKQLTLEAFEKLLLSFFYKQDGSLIKKEEKQMLYTSTYKSFTSIDLSQHHHFWFQLFDFKQYFQNKLSRDV